MSYRWIDSDSALTELLDTLRAEPRYAIDTEFMGERSYRPRIALVQLGWKSGVALIDPLAVSLEPLAELLRGEGLAIVHAADQDLALLERACGARPAKLFDPQLAAAFLGLGVPSLAVLTRELLGIELEKGSQLADWMRRPLSETELRYAASDVEHLLAIHELLAQRLRERGRERWVEAELESLRTRSPRETDASTLWWRLKGVGKLRGRARRVAQEVTAWREREAERRDRPVRTVLSDLAILALASRPPSKKQDLRAIRGIDVQRLRPGEIEGLLEAVQRGLGLKDDEVRLPPPPRAKQSSVVHAQILMAVVGEIADREQIERSFLATRDDLDTFLAGGPSRLREGVRYELVGRLLDELVAGRVAIRLADEDRLELLHGAS